MIATLKKSLRHNGDVNAPVVVDGGTRRCRQPEASELEDGAVGTPLLLAIETSNVKIVRWLVDHGANSHKAGMLFSPVDDLAKGNGVFEL